MSEEKEMTAPNVSIGVDTEQSSIKQTTNSISNRDVNFNPFDEFFKKIDPSYMKTVTMQELYQDIYSKKPPVIEGLLYQGTYLFVGSPKDRQKLLYGAACLSCQHRYSALGLSCEKGYGSLPCTGR